MIVKTKDVEGNTIQLELDEKVVEFIKMTAIITYNGFDLKYWINDIEYEF